MSSHGAAGAGIFSASDYTTWCRALYASAPDVRNANILFESTIAEPAELLRGAIDTAFGTRTTDRFVSVFGAGNPFLVAALAKKYGATREQIVCTTGATNAIAMVLRSLPESKRHVVAETPRLDLLEHLPRAFGCDVTDIARRGEDFDIDPDELRRALKPDTGLVLISNPHNPSGMVLPPERIRQLARIAGQAGAMLLVDEVYSDLAPGFEPAASLAANAISANSLTKSYGLFSLRCGWLLAAPDIARQVEAANTRVEFGASKLSHAVAAHVAENMAPFDAWWRSVLDRNRPVLERHVAAMVRDGLIAGDLPASGCMYFPRIVGCDDTHTLARRLWEEDRVLVAPGEFFGRPGHVRLGFGLADGRLDEGLSRLAAGLKRLAGRQAAPKTAGASR